MNEHKIYIVCLQFLEAEVDGLSFPKLDVVIVPGVDLSLAVGWEVPDFAGDEYVLSFEAGCLNSPGIVFLVAVEESCVDVPDA